MKSKHKKILLLTADNYEDLELHYPRLRLKEAGFNVVIAGAKKGNIYKSKHGYDSKADISFNSVNVSDFGALVIPGGYAPDTLRAIPRVLKIVKEFNKQKKLIAFICHAGWIPVSADVLKGIKCTSYFTIKDDMINAGAKWVDKEVVVDKNFISSRSPDDLPAFCKEIISFLSDKK